MEKIRCPVCGEIVESAKWKYPESGWVVQHERISGDCFVVGDHARTLMKDLERRIENGAE